jgi:RNA polymerase-binding transcription factor DksA
MVKQAQTAEPMAPGILDEFADMLHERRSQIAPSLTRNSRSMYDLWTILHEREVAQIDEALTRIRKGSYGVCAACGCPIQFLHLFLEPASDCCLGCRPKSRPARIA